MILRQRQDLSRHCGLHLRCEAVLVCREVVVCLLSVVKGAAGCFLQLGSRLAYTRSNYTELFI